MSLDNFLPMDEIARILRGESPLSPNDRDAKLPRVVVSLLSRSNFCVKQNPNTTNERTKKQPNELTMRFGTPNKQ